MRPSPSNIVAQLTKTDCICCPILWNDMYVWYYLIDTTLTNYEFICIAYQLRVPKSYVWTMDRVGDALGICQMINNDEGEMRLNNTLQKGRKEGKGSEREEHSAWHEGWRRCLSPSRCVAMWHDLLREQWHREWKWRWCDGTSKGCEVVQFSWLWRPYLWHGSRPPCCKCEVVLSRGRFLT